MQGATRSRDGYGCNEFQSYRIESFRIWPESFFLGASPVRVVPVHMGLTKEQGDLVANTDSQHIFQKKKKRKMALTMLRV